MSLPSGIFTPAVLTGASLGGVAVIKFQKHFDENITPSTFALLGVAALLAGVQRSTVSLCIILVEGTGQVELCKHTMVFGNEGGSSCAYCLVRVCLTHFALIAFSDSGHHNCGHSSLLGRVSQQKRYL